MGLYQTKKLFKAKEAINSEKQLTEWEKIFSDHS